MHDIETNVTVRTTPFDPGARDIATAYDMQMGRHQIMDPSIPPPGVIRKRTEDVTGALRESLAALAYIERRALKTYRTHMEEFIANGGKVQVLDGAGRVIRETTDISLPRKVDGGNDGK